LCKQTGTSNKCKRFGRNFRAQALHRMKNTHTQAHTHTHTHNHQPTRPTTLLRGPKAIITHTHAHVQDTHTHARTRTHMHTHSLTCASKHTHSHTHTHTVTVPGCLPHCNPTSIISLYDLCNKNCFFLRGCLLECNPKSQFCTIT